MIETPKTRDNHYVPEWYQRGFLSNQTNKLHYLNLIPDTKRLSDGRVVTMNSRSSRPVSQCFYQTDLYTTFFGAHINDEVERFLFGQIDDVGSRAVRAFIETNIGGWHTHFSDFFSYMDSQKIRTPKGLDWIKENYRSLGQVELMTEMQALRQLHCTLWTEGVREIVSAKESKVKFILSDHPITMYNYACAPTSKQCAYPNDPHIALKGTQTLFALDKDHCLILTNLEYAQDSENEDPIENRTNPKPVRQSMVRTDKIIRSRCLNENEVSTINLIIKSRARRYIAASVEDWLYPEESMNLKWADLKNTLLPPSDKLNEFGGEIYAGYEDGRSYYQDAFGRTHPENKYLRKSGSKKDVGRNDPCGCGNGKKFKNCCEKIPEDDRPSWDVLSIRERNLILYNGISNILGLNKGKSWDDVRRELADDQIVEIHNLYGSLWPIETDIFSLLPRSDHTLRALYTGMIDPRMAAFIALGSAPYFDEILIQHPFVNPGAVKKEFSPVYNPHQFKSQMLKDLLLFLYLHPFVETGVVNFIPNPCVFDNHLFHQMMNMAEQRAENQKMNEKEKERYFNLHKEDFARTIRMLSKEKRISQIRQAMPDISQELLEEILEYMDEQNKEDPLALLQEDVLEEDGQLSISSMAPNFEMALFIAQVTGSIILTDSETRWEEIQKAQFKESGIASHPWSDLCNFVGTINFPFNANPTISFDLRMNTHFGKIRKSLRELHAIVKQDQISPDSILVERLKTDFLSGYKNSIKGIDVNDQHKFDGKMNFLIPKGGFVDNNVQRLLLTSGSQRHLSNTPMAIFVEPS